MSRLILDLPRGESAGWLPAGELRLPPGATPGLAALHTPDTGPLTLSLWRAGHPLAEVSRDGGPGWRFLALPGLEADTLRWHAPTLRLTRQAGGLTRQAGGAGPALRLWAAPAADWSQARWLGRVTLVMLGNAPPCPYLRLAAGEIARLTPPPGVMPQLQTLRGTPPRQDHDGPTLILRAGATWEGTFTQR